MTASPAPPILLTSAIHVSAPLTALTDTALRLDAHLASLSAWSRTRGVREIVICDGSGFDLDPHIDPIRKENPNVVIEVLSFQNDRATVARRGKGYGEGEIVAHALKESRLLRDRPAFGKCTGKLWLENFGACLKGWNGRAGFNLWGRSRIDSIDTRFYLVARSFFENHLQDRYRNVDDPAGYYLEHSYRDGLSGLSPRSYVMWPAPRLQGLSGSSGRGLPRQGLGRVKNDLRNLAYRAGVLPL
ncbi:hypothetical protein CG51_11205 [Haematobacter missouriensis]|uniref:Glycosyl transferase n=1 Tax=Haematobacter missouriensis TaxID=366616 RepID=A0ABX3ZZW2_9RHOB|nr:hypothetical protein [Haematobacter missouriensis]KFI27090.1 hypothetical protein CG51_11205 [Haematobacter missouriensis]OWJ78702.1 hypothetical protein CDV53_02700 [Haematobacter missouriensis]